jgi:hypothetical protein
MVLCVILTKKLLMIKINSIFPKMLLCLIYITVFNCFGCVIVCFGFWCRYVDKGYYLFESLINSVVV